MLNQHSTLQVQPSLRVNLFFVSFHLQERLLTHLNDALRYQDLIFVTTAPFQHSHRNVLCFSLISAMFHFLQKLVPLTVLLTAPISHPEDVSDRGVPSCLAFKLPKRLVQWLKPAAEFGKQLQLSSVSFWSLVVFKGKYPPVMDPLCLGVFYTSDGRSPLSEPDCLTEDWTVQFSQTGRM